MKNIPTAQLIEAVRSALKALPDSPPGGARDQFDELVRRIEAKPKHIGFYVVTDLPNGETLLSPTNAGWVDGYDFGDRLLEGLLFKITVDENGVIVAQIHDDPSLNIQGLDINYWLLRAIEHARVCDVFCGDPAADGETPEIVLYDPAKPHTQQSANFTKAPLFGDH